MDISKMTEDEILDNLKGDEFPLFGSIKRLQPEQQTSKVVQAAMDKCSLNFNYIKDDKLKTDEIVMRALDRDGFRANRDKSIKENIINAIKNGVFIFNRLPARLRDKDVCQAAVECLGHFCIPDIPRNVLTEEMCFQASQDISNDKIKEISLSAIPYPSVCLSILQNKGNEIGAFDLMEMFNPSVIDSAVANEAIRQDMRCIALIPEEVLYNPPAMTWEERYDISSVAFDHLPPHDAFFLLPEERRTELVSFVAVTANPTNLYLVPKENRSDRVIEVALKQRGELIRWLDPDELTDARQILAIKNISPFYPEIMENIPKRLLNEEICNEVVSRCPRAIKYIPEEFKTNKVCQSTLDNIKLPDDNYKILPYIPVDIVTAKLNQLKVYDVREVLNSIQPENLNSTIIEWVIKNGDRVFGEIPREKITAEHCLLQEKQYPGYFQKNPDDFPKHINNKEGNIYDLNRLVEGMSKEHFSFQQIKDLYEGKRLDGRNKSFIFNPKDKSLRVVEYRPKKTVEQKEEQPPTKGKRIKR